SALRRCSTHERGAARGLVGDEVVGRCAIDHDGGERRLGREADRRLQRLIGDRLGGVDQLLQRGDAGVGSLQCLHAVADTIEQIVDVAGARVERGRGKIVGGVVESGVDFLASGKAILGGGKQIRGGLQREQVLTNRRRENYTGHY